LILRRIDRVLVKIWHPWRYSDRYR
jgi:hypothetical protein